MAKSQLRLLSVSSTGIDKTKPTVDTDLKLKLLLVTIDAGDILNAITDLLITSVLGILGPTVGEIVNSTADDIAKGLADTVASGHRSVGSSLRKPQQGCRTHDQRAAHSEGSCTGEPG